MIFRRKNKEEEVSEEEEKHKNKKKEKEENELVWDKKRIMILIAVLFFLIFAAREVKGMFFPDTNILGESTTKTIDEIDKPGVVGPGLDLQSKVNTSLEDVQGSISNIDPEEVASSSPQIQKVLRDIQSIKNLPTDKARDACMNICSKL